MLEQRAALLELLSESLDPRRPFVRVGESSSTRACTTSRSSARAYGLDDTARSARSACSGPLRMDYDKAIRTVRAAAYELSRFVEDVYEEN